MRRWRLVAVVLAVAAVAWLAVVLVMVAGGPRDW